MSGILIAVEGGSLALSTLVALNMLGNLRTYRRLGEYVAIRPDTVPLVSVLVPARDEAANIAACVQSLLAQDYPAFEVLVLDDGSTDCTGAIVRALAAGDDRLTLISGKTLPPGWTGKGFACHQLAESARGEIYLFTDADTHHAPHMIRAVVGATAGGADVVTSFPEQELGGWAEVLAVPMMLFTVWAFLPVGRVWSDPSPQFTAANGQLLAFTQVAYATIGGHAAVRDSILEDMGLAQRAKSLGLKLRLADGTGTTRTRMYRSPGEVWRGFSKNAYALLGGSLWLAVAFTVLLVALYILPVVVLVTGIATAKDGWAWRWFPLVLIALMLVQRGILAWRTRLPGWQAMLHPFSVLAFVLILANSVRWQQRGYGVWKGRVYATTPAPPPDVPADTAAPTQ